MKYYSYTQVINLTTIEFNPNSYTVISKYTPNEWKNTNIPLLKLVQYNQETYGILQYNMSTAEYDVLCISNNKKYLDLSHFWCRLADDHLTKSPMNVMVKLPDDQVYSEVFQNNEYRTLMEKLEICMEIYEEKQLQQITNFDRTSFILCCLNVVLMIIWIAIIVKQVML